MSEESLKPHVIMPGENESSYFSMTRFSPMTDDFYFRDGYLVILHPFDVIWEAPVLARSTKSLEAHIRFIQEKRIKKAIVVAEDIAFLRGCPELEDLQILIPYSAADFDYSPLYDMPNLKALDCQTIHGPKGDRRTAVDYSRIPHLQRLYASGTKGHRNLAAVKGLRKLYLGQGQPESRTLSDLHLHDLEELDLCQASLRSLAGLETAQKLKRLDITSCRSLEDASALAELGNSLTSLEIESCGKIRDFSWLHKLPNLEYLVLKGPNSIPDLSFLREMKKLKFFRFTMNVLDGDLSLCRDIPCVYCKNRKHYNLKEEDLPKGKTE